MTTSEAGARGLKPTLEMGVWIFICHKLALFPWVPKCPSPILYWDSRKSETTLYRCPMLISRLLFTLPYLP